MMPERPTRSHRAARARGRALLKPGDEIDVWVVDRALGQGGMGSVYRCHNREAKRILAAVKVLDSSLGRLPHAKARFVREAEILFSLDHPGIVKVRNVRMDLAMPYLEMEFIDGVNLEARIAEGPMSPADALPLFRQVADALAYLHERGIRHRDVKPSNIVIQPSGTPKLVDFGIATESDGATITQQGQTFGSVSYAPPEWLDPAELDPVLWDVYAAGVVFWEVLTGVQAFPMPGVGTIQQQVVRMIAVKQRHPPLDPGPKVPAALRTLLREMTHPRWSDRIASMAEVRARLDAVDLAAVDPTEVASARSVPTWFPDATERAKAGATMVPGFEDTEERPREDTGRAAPGLPAVAAAAPEPTAVPPTPMPAPMAAPMPPAPEPHARPAPSGLGPAARVVGALVALAAVGMGLAFWRAAPPSSRELVVTLAGVPDGAPVVVTANGARPAEVRGRTHVFSVAPGNVALRAAVGESCAAVDGDPAWCARTDATLQVEAASEPLGHALQVTPAAPRPLRVALAGLPADAAPRARVGEGAFVTGDATGVTLPDVSPGRLAVTVALGTCAEADLGCAATACPPGCSSWKGELVVPPGEGAFTADVALPVPEAAGREEPRGAAPPTAAVSARPARGKGGSVVTAGAYAKWLVAHPDWAPDAARAAGKADGSYLSGWDGASPPGGKEASAVVNVSWAAASAYCAGRGGLPGVDDPPLTWTESAAQPWHEYRSADGRPAWRRSDGATSIAVKRGESGAFVGFRCAR